MTETFYTSDHHFWHRNIGVLCQRPLVEREEMDELMVQRWNEVVRPGDRVRHLGDFSLSIAVAERIAPRLNGDITIYSGNHDEFWSHNHKAARAASSLIRASEVFDEVIPEGMGTVNIRGQEVLLSHLPYHGDSRHDERYANLRPRDEGLPIICGHVHTAWKNLNGDEGRVHRGQVNVGVDVWDFRPVPEDTVADLLGLGVG